MTAKPPGSAAQAPPEAAPVWLFGPPEAAVGVANADLLLAHLPVFLGGWPVQWAGPGAGEAEIELRADGTGGFTIATRGPAAARMTADNEMDAANALAGALVAAFVAKHPEMVCFHAGAALVGGGLAVMLGETGAGKSSVSLQLCALGYRLFGDDRLAVRLGRGRMEGLCLGLMPKLRLPLPPESGRAMHEFVDAYSEIRSEEAAYLRPWDSEAAGFGETAPLGALVLLERGGEAPAALEPVAPAEAVRALLANVFAPHWPAEALVAAMKAMSEACPIRRLRWTESRAAARLLADTPGGPGRA